MSLLHYPVAEHHDPLAESHGPGLVMGCQIVVTPSVLFTLIN
jgi:hypothetical protein